MMAYDEACTPKKGDIIEYRDEIGCHILEADAKLPLTYKQTLVGLSLERIKERDEKLLVGIWEGIDLKGFFPHNHEGRENLKEHIRKVFAEVDKERDK